MTPAAQRIYSVLHERYGDVVTLETDRLGEHVIINKWQLVVCSVFEKAANVIATSTCGRIRTPVTPIRRPELAAGMIIGTLTALELKDQHANN